MPGHDPTRFILIGTSHAGNVGAAARAMKVMGFSDLVLVAPRDPNLQRKAEAVAMASGATDVLANARVVADMTQALDGITFVCATAMTPRDFGPPTHAPRDLLAALKDSSDRIAFVFGSERFGMSNDDVYRCHACLSIPTRADYGSLNLSQAVQLIAYEWRQALGGFDVVPRTTDTPRADAAALQGLIEHWRVALEQIGFHDPAAPKKLLPRLNRLLNRAQLTQEEVHILRGIAKAVQERCLPQS
jgi:tRNA/rRNA methyltransferase